MDPDIGDKCRVIAWRPPVPGIAEVFHARIVDYAYPAHCHDTWTVLIVDDGALRYDLDIREHGAARDTVAILPPGVVHNGSPATHAGRFRKRNLYLDSGFLPAGLAGAAVDGSSIRDAPLRAAISALHDRLTDPDPLDAEARLALIAERFRRRLASRPASPREPELPVAGRLRDFLDGHITSPITLGDASAVLHRSVPHLVRSFTHRYRISPHAYVVGARVQIARKLLLAGLPPARVAAEAGFSDQAHLTRHFTRHLSVPPARYASSAAGHSLASRP